MTASSRAASAAPRGGLVSAAITLALLIPVAYAVSDHGLLFGVTALAGGGLLAVALAVVLPFGAIFQFGAAIGIAIYICLYAILGRTAFPAALWWVDPIGFLLPIIVFVLGLLVQRHAVAQWRPEDSDDPDPLHLVRAGAWFIWCAVVAVTSLSLPLNRLPPEGQTAVLLLVMGIIALLSLRAMRELVLMLADVAEIFSGIAVRLKFLAAPIITFSLLFGLLAVVFGCFYRVADGLSARPLFQRYGELARLDFAETLHFSIVTLATVGYGDILPVDEGVRLLAAVQMLLGQLLLLFGFAEVMRQRVRD